NAVAAITAYESAITGRLDGLGVIQVEDDHYDALTYIGGQSSAYQAVLNTWSGRTTRVTDATNGTNVQFQGSAKLFAMEVVWVVPMLIGQRLQGIGQYQQALDWYWVVLPYNGIGLKSGDPGNPMPSFSFISDELTDNPPSPDLTFEPD